ncbi:MAG: YcaQ family DNA glycosylase [Planctomycetales bacterium]|nr:YcaQ family DNA glycosylase [Planctomycetales bacterium]
MQRTTPCQLTQQQVVRLWLHQQGLLDVSRPRKLDANSLTEHLETTGGLQVDSVNVLDRAHYLTLFSRFGVYEREQVDGWVYRDRLAYEYWGHEACILPISHLPIGKRRMKDFPPDSWRKSTYWQHFNTSIASRRRVLKRLREEGPLGSSAFEIGAVERQNRKILGWGSAMPKEDKRTLEAFWHGGRIAITARQHFRKVYDLAENVYRDCPPASRQEYLDSWLLVGLRGNGVASEQHLVNYVTAPSPNAAERKQTIHRNLRSGRVVQVRVDGFTEPFYALPETLDLCTQLGAPCGTTLLCPFDSLLWQRIRAEQLLDYRYRIEIYIPAAKRNFGYYALPILHDGRLVGQIDPKLHRNQQQLEIKALQFEPWFRVTRRFRKELNECFERLAEFVNATNIQQAPVQ